MHIEEPRPHSRRHAIDHSGSHATPLRQFWDNELRAIVQSKMNFYRLHR